MPDLENNEQNEITQEEMASHGCVVGLCGLGFLGGGVSGLGLSGYGLVTGDQNASTLGTSLLYYGVGGSIATLCASEFSARLYRRYFPEPIRTEREKILHQYSKKESKNPNFLFDASDNFIVSFDDASKIRKKLKESPDIAPKNVVEYLDSNLPEVLALFQLDQPEGFQVVHVTTGGGLSKFFAAGLHFGKQDGEFSTHKWSEAYFNKVFPQPLRHTQSEHFGIYDIAVHEALGHGIAQVGLKVGSEAFQLVTEGIPTYVDRVIKNENPHDEFRYNLFLIGNERFTNMSGRWTLDEMPHSQIVKVAQKPAFLRDMSLVKSFSLDSTIGTTDRLPYMRGCSFIDYFLNSYGLQAFKQLVGQVNKSNFHSRLQDLTSKTVEQLESEWKEVVLAENFFDNPFIRQNECDLDAQLREKYHKQRLQILEVLKKLA
jgi:hypothetical protein